MNHKLKLLPEYYKAVLKGLKTFELRKNDRNFQIGDKLILQEWDKDKGYSKEAIIVSVSYILHGGQYGLEEGYCIMSIIKENG